MDREYAEKKARADKLHVDLFMKMGVPEEVARQSLPSDSVGNILFGKDLLFKKEPLVKWIKENRPGEFHKLSPALQALVK